MSSSLQIECLVSRLQDLREGPLAFHDIVHLGDAAVPAIERILRGRAQAIHQTRTLAADALAAIATPEAVRALTRAMLDSIERDLPPQLLEAESVLVNHIAGHLSHSSDPEVAAALLAALRRRCYPWCATALGRIGDPRAVPLLIECLHDDPARPRAAAALRQLGAAAAAPLARVLLEPRTDCEWEAPGEIDARMTAAHVLGDLGLEEDSATVAIDALRRALGDRQRSVRIEAALALARLQGPDADDAVRVLAVALDEASWARAQDIRDALVRIGAPAEPLVISLIGLRPQDEADRRRRLRAVQLAGALGSAAAVPLLESFSHAPDLELRSRAITALDTIPAADTATLSSYLTDAEPRIRRRAVQGLRRRGALGPECAMRLLGDEDSGVRHLALSSVRSDLEAALPAVKRAVYGLGAPLTGWVPRWRLWRHASALLVSHLLLGCGASHRGTRQAPPR